MDEQAVLTEPDGPKPKRTYSWHGSSKKRDSPIPGPCPGPGGTKLHAGISAREEGQGPKRPTPANISPTQLIINDIPSTTSSVRLFDELCLNLVKSLSIQSSLHVTSPTDNASQKFVWSSRADCPLLFRSLCICDPKIKGNPILHRSKYFSIGPRGLKVGACEFANFVHEKPGGRGTFDLSVRPGVDGRPQFVLEFCNALLNVETGFPTWIVGSQVDVTNFVHKLVILDRHQYTEGIRDQSSKLPEANKSFVEYDTEIDDADSAVEMGSESEMVGRESSLMIHPNKSFIFYQSGLDQLAYEIDASIDWVKATCSPCKANPGRPANFVVRNDKLRETMADETLGAHGAFTELLRDIDFLHRSYFILAPSSDLRTSNRGVTSSHWVIAAMSPYLYSRTADRRIALSRTPVELLHNLGLLLSYGKPVSCLVNWGQHGDKKLLYCSPMLRGDKTACWLCFLIDPGLRDLWGFGACS